MDKDHFRIFISNIASLKNKHNSKKLSAAFDQLSIKLTRDELECINIRNRFLQGNLPQNKDSELINQELLDVLTNHHGMLSSMLLLKLSKSGDYVMDKEITQVIKWRMIMNG